MSVLSKRIKAIENELIEPIQPPSFVWISICEYGDDDVLAYQFEGIEVIRIENENIADLQERTQKILIENDTRDCQYRYFFVMPIYEADLLVNALSAKAC
jgi:hypothetical protein